MNIELIVPTLLTLAIFSLLYKETPVYRFVEHLFIGTTLGYAIVVNIKTINNSGIQQIIQGNYIYVFAILLGLLMYSRYFPKNYDWLNRVPLSLVVGSTIGVTIRGIPETNIHRQIQATYKPLFGSGSLLTDANNIILIASFLFSLLYFTYTFSNTNSENQTNTMTRVFNFGRIFLMIYFGALFGNVIIHRASLFISRMQFIIFDLFGY